MLAARVAAAAAYHPDGLWKEDELNDFLAAVGVLQVREGDRGRGERARGAGGAGAVRKAE